MAFKLPTNIKTYTTLLSILPQAISSNLRSTQMQYCRWLIRESFSRHRQGGLLKVFYRHHFILRDLSKQKVTYKTGQLCSGARALLEPQ